MPALLYRTTIPRPDDPDIIESICQELGKGSPQAVAAYRAGIHEDTLYHWRYEGQAELAALQGRWVPWEELGSHAQLVIRIKEAEAGFVSEAIDNWRGSKVNDWARWATLLERRRPQDFGRHTDVHVGGQSQVLVVSTEVTAGVLEESRRRYLAWLGEQQGLLMSGDTEPERS